ncbi:autophagy protein 16 [Aspergillus indologenus CBS 114.80]|uniref:Autophagy protein 16 n=1 Tax=Aspergillus indologenus CBS 114.80 TaxID=1450541 RepID=A0A2V5IEU6_9EURO|nr:autophagy protein 16 [Aspergillus indologenus CBS 114.80]
MAHWREEYSAALASRDRREKANTALYDAYTKLADRTASSNRQTSSVPAAGARPSTKPHPQPAGGVPAPNPPSGTAPPAPPAPAPAPETRTLLADLAEAQRSRAELQAQLARATAELERLRKRSAQDGRRLRAFEQEVAQLQMRLKDREEELRGKAKLLEVWFFTHALTHSRTHALGWLEAGWLVCLGYFREGWGKNVELNAWLTELCGGRQDFQDEMASLNLQLNMAEERSARFQQENQDLVDRWMAKVGQEADAMNANSRFS